jgi:hypothetical protein
MEPGSETAVAVPLKWTPSLLAPADMPAKDRAEPKDMGMSNMLEEAIRKLHDEGDYYEPARGVGSIVYDRTSMDFNDYKPVQRIPFSERPVNIVTINHGLANNIIGIQFDYRVAVYELEHKVSK